MKKLIHSILGITLTLLISGCDVNELDTPSSQPQIDQGLPSVDAEHIRMITTMSSVALEWKNITIPSSYGYYVYRANLNTDSQRLQRVAKIKNKFTSHYLDTDLEPDTQYLYAISTRGIDNTESSASQSVETQTKPRFKSVSFIAATSNLPRQVKILWRPHTNKSVEKYILERSITSKEEFRKIKTIRARLKVEYIDTDLKDNTTYAYRIKAITYDRIKSSPSEIVTATTKALPSGTSSIQATMNLPKKIILTWEAPEDTSDLTKYIIYSSNSETGQFTELKALSINDKTEFIHEIDSDDKVKYYKITTVDKDKLESTIKIAPTMGKTLNVPAQPEITLAMIEGNKIVLNWRPTDNRAVAYNIHKIIRKNLLSYTTESILNITDVRFEDMDILRGTTYDYRIEAIDLNGLVSQKTPSTRLTIPRSMDIDNATSPTE